VQAWLKKHPRFVCHFVPTSSSWLNLVERWFRELTEKAIRRRSFGSVPDLNQAIEAFLQAWNQNPKPFIWSATVEEIIKKIDRARVKMEQIKPGSTQPRGNKRIRQRQSHLKFHLIPAFGKVALMSLDVRAVQGFTTNMLKTNSRKTILNVLGTFFAVLDYAGKCGIPITPIKMENLAIAPDRGEVDIPYISPKDAPRIIAASVEPYKSIFALA
jgi:DDE superfamily endonuclease